MTDFMRPRGATPVTVEVVVTCRHCERDAVIAVQQLSRGYTGTCRVTDPDEPPELGYEIPDRCACGKRWLSNALVRDVEDTAHSLLWDLHTARAE